MPDAIDLKKAKAYKCGPKDLVTLHNDFEMAIGKAQATMGVAKREYPFPIPVTVMDRSIHEFCSEVNTIYLIMLKEPSDKKYSVLFYEIAKNILDKADFDYNVLDKIHVVD